MSVVAHRAAAPHEWDDAWRATPWATYFQSREWAEVWADAHLHVRPDARHVTFDDGRTAILPVSRRERLRGAVAQHLASPAGTFGGWISEDDLSSEHAPVLVDQMLGLRGGLSWRLNPYDEQVRGVDVPASAPDETHVVDLADGFEAVRRRWRRGQKSSFKKAVNAGVTVTLASTEEDWGAFDVAYRASLDRWGTSATSQHPRRLFDALRERRSEHVRLWLAKTGDDDVAAGALCFYAREHAVYWAGAAHEEHFPLRPVNLLLAEAIRDACKRGYRWFDLNPSGGHDGVKAFKLNFGAEPRPCPIVERRPAAARLLGGVARAIRHGSARLHRMSPGA